VQVTTRIPENAVWNPDVQLRELRVPVAGFTLFGSVTSVIPDGTCELPWLSRILLREGANHDQE